MQTPPPRPDKASDGITKYKTDNMMGLTNTGKNIIYSTCNETKELVTTLDENCIDKDIYYYQYGGKCEPLGKLISINKNEINGIGFTNIYF